MKIKKIIKYFFLTLALIACVVLIAGGWLFFKAFYGGSIIHMAATTNNIPLLRLSLALGEDINRKESRFKDSIETTPLEWASEAKATDAAIYLIDKGAAPIGGRSALGLAAKAGDIEIVRHMLSHGVDANIEDNIVYKQTALDYLIIQNGIGKVDDLARKEEILHLLIQNGANVNHVKKETEWTPLYEAAFYARPSFFKILLDNGANPNAIVEGQSVRDYVMTSRSQWPAGEREMIARILEESSK